MSGRHEGNFCLWDKLLSFSQICILFLFFPVGGSREEMFERGYDIQLQEEKIHAVNNSLDTVRKGVEETQVCVKQDQ